MRSLFGAGIVFSLVGAGVFGSTLAWQNHTSVDSSATVGILAFDFGGTSNALLQTVPGVELLPGLTLRVMNGQLQNSGTYSFMLDPSSTVDITGVSTVGSNPARPACALSNFVPKFVDDALSDGQRQVQPGAVGAPFHVEVTVTPTAPSNCSGQDVSYTIRVVVRNIAPNQSYGHLPVGAVGTAGGATTPAEQVTPPPSSPPVVVPPAGPLDGSKPHIETTGH
jgi:hypothetical protein